MRYVAKVERVLRTEIHKVVVAIHGNEITTKDMGLPNRVEIEIDESGHCMMYRYQDDDTFCGDTWHEDLEDAQSQAEYEYGIASNAWIMVE